MSVGRPQRRSNMSLAQEKLGWIATMQSWDWAVHMAAHGTEEDLKGVVGVPKDFVEQRNAGNIVAVFSDQVPIWLARSSRARRSVFADHEKVRNSKESKKARAGKPQEILSMSEQQASQRLPGQVRKLSEKAAQEGMSQTRSGAAWGR